MQSLRSVNYCYALDETVLHMTLKDLVSIGF